MTRRLVLIILLITCLSSSFYSCKSAKSTTTELARLNSKESMKKPYIVLISLDGFRWDYVSKYNPPHLSKLISNGVKTDALVPVFPSKTFPNHYSIATGMYPDNHGILGNSFYNYEKDLTYAIRNRERVEDGAFYKGTPIWVQAEKNDMISASYFFVGSEADVQGIKPTYYHRYDGRIENEDRISEALRWLALKETIRPHMITMYFSDIDDIGHDVGPNNEEKLREEILKLDAQLGTLFKGIKATNLDVNIIIVSDHGMAAQSTSKLISIDSLLNTELYKTINNGAIVNIHPKKEVYTDSIISLLNSKRNHFKVYKTKNTPGFEHSPKNKDWGAIQLIPDEGYYFVTTSRVQRLKEAKIETIGVHGFNTENKEMHGIFYAQGPAFKKGASIKAAKNIHVYPILCKILGLPIPNDIDGNFNVLSPLLKSE